MASTQGRSDASEAFAIVQQISSHIGKDRIQEIVDRAMELTKGDNQLVVDLLSVALEKTHHLLKSADHVLLLLTKIASAANVFARNRTISSQYLASAEEEYPDVFKILGKSPTRVEVVKRGKKDNTEVFNEGLVTWAHLSHANILPIYSAFLEGDSGPVSLVSPQMLKVDIANHAKTLPQAARMPLISDVIEGLCYLHTLGIVHGDLNPENVLISHDGRALITGLSNSPGSQDSDFCPGRYSAPELLDDDDAAPKTGSDMWSLGCVIYEVLSGKVPFYQTRHEIQVGKAIAAGKKPIRPPQGGGGAEEISDAIWRPVSNCWEWEAKDRPTCLQFQRVFSSIVIQDKPPALKPNLSEVLEHGKESYLNLDLARPILIRVVGSDLSMPPPSKVPEQLRKSLSGLTGKSETLAVAATKLSPKDTQTLVDVVELIIRESPSNLSAVDAIMTLRKVMMSTHILPQRYKINRIPYDPTPIAEDDFGKMYKGLDLDVCVGVVTNPGDVSTLIDGFAFWANLAHSNLVPLHGVFYEGANELQRFCLVSPFMKNGLLRDYAPRLPQKDRLPLISDAINALVYLQSLVFISTDVRGDSFLISDTGHALVVAPFMEDILTAPARNGDTLTSGSYTLRFRSPEVAQGGTKEGVEGDSWSFGCLCYEILSRKPPYHQYAEESEIRAALSRGETPRRPDATESDIDEVSDQFWDFIKRCCTPEPRERLTVLEMQKLLEEMKIPDHRNELNPFPGVEALALRPPPDFNWDDVKRVVDKIQVEVLRLPLSKVIQNHTKEVAAVVGNFNTKDTRTLVDFLDLALKDHITLSDERNRVLALLSRITTSTYIFPRRYELSGIKYETMAIASGGFGTVHRGVSDPSICVKVMAKVDSTALMGFVKELIMWAHFWHPNVLPFYGVFVDESECLCLVSPFMNKGNLHNYAPQLPQKNRISLLYDVIKGLVYLHGLGIVHTDLKGENVLISEQGRGLITDFGASHVITSTAMGGSTTASVASTLRFTAPEIISDRHSRPTQACDIWSFGCLCYEVLSRKLPYFEYKLEAQILAALSRKQPPKRPSSTIDSAEDDDDFDEFDEPDWDEIDDPSWNLITRLCAPKPEDRPNTSRIEELIVDLKMWDNRPEAKDAPGIEILRSRLAPEVDLNRAGELLNQLQVRFMTQRILRYPLEDVVAAVKKLRLEQEDAIALLHFWDLTLTAHLFISEENKQALALLSAFMTATGELPFGFFLLTSIRYSRASIGSGSFGEVHQGSNPNLCVKVTNPDKFNSDLKEQWYKALAPAEYSSHPNILPFYGIAAGPDSALLVSPFMRNGNLSKYALSLPPKSRMLLISDVIEAVMHLHSLGLVHGNLKGENILISDVGRGIVCDFRPYHINIAAADLGLTGSYVTGTLRFVAPELVNDSQMLPAYKSDIWSIGCLIYLVLSGKVPFHQYSQDADIRLALSRGELPLRPILAEAGVDEIEDLYWDMITKCCAQKPDDRPTLPDIQKWLANLGVRDDRPLAKPFLGAEVLKHRFSQGPGFDVERIEHILAQITSQFRQVAQDVEREGETQE